MPSRPWMNNSQVRSQPVPGTTTITWKETSGAECVCELHPHQHLWEWWCGHTANQRGPHYWPSSPTPEPQWSKWLPCSCTRLHHPSSRHSIFSLVEAALPGRLCHVPAWQCPPQNRPRQGRSPSPCCLADCSRRACLDAAWTDHKACKDKDRAHGLQARGHDNRHRHYFMKGLDGTQLVNC